SAPPPPCPRAPPTGAAARPPAGGGGGGGGARYPARAPPGAPPGGRAPAPARAARTPARAAGVAGGPAVGAARAGRRPRRGAAPHQRGEGLVLGVLAGPQRGGGLLVCRVARQVVAAEPLDRRDAARGDEAGARVDRVTADGDAILVHQREPRPAGRAGDRLGVEPPVSVVVILARARGAHRKRRHGRARAIVGDVAHDGEARAAVRAVGKRVAEAPIAGVEQLPEAIVARRRIRRHERVAAHGPLAIGDREGGVVPQRDKGGAHALDDGERRRLPLEIGDE